MPPKTLLLLTSLIGLLTGCSQPMNPQEMASFATSPVYYTQFSLFADRSTPDSPVFDFHTTNYRSGRLIPINSEVTLLSINQDQAVVRLNASGEILTIENDQKFTIDPMPIAFSKVIGTGKVDLSQFTAAERENILAGQAQPGMRKQAVIAAMGYPPQHKTPSLDSNKWLYWSKRLENFGVFFRNDVVEDVAK